MCIRDRLGAIAFLLINTGASLNVMNDNWIRSGYVEKDIIQHYTGWLFYRQSPVSFPLGMSSAINYPPVSYTHLLRRSLLLRTKKRVVGIAPFLTDAKPVSYTHLDVYKRQAAAWPATRGCPFSAFLCSAARAPYFPCSPACRTSLSRFARSARPLSIPGLTRPASILLRAAMAAPTLHIIRAGAGSAIVL